MTVEIRPAGHQVLLSVTDTGCGIQEEQLPHLFDRFLRREDARDPQPHGLGLGLPICQHIAERHGGTMMAESRPGQGSRFTLSLGRHVHPIRHEGYKLLLSNAALGVLILLLAVQVLAYRDFSGPQGIEEVYYRQYSTQLSGQPSADKAAYLDQVEQQLEEAQEEMLQLLSQGGTSIWKTQRMAELGQKLQAQLPLEKARTQYEALEPGQSYIYTTPYELLYDASGQAANRIDLAKLLLSLSLCLPFFFSMERETGVGVLVESAGAAGDVRRRKRLVAWLFAVACTAAAFLPRMVAVYQTYGLPQLTARANSLARFAALPDLLPLWGVLALTLVGWCVLAWVGCAVAEVVSARVRFPLAAALICVLLLPGLSLLLTL